MGVCSSISWTSSSMRQECRICLFFQTFRVLCKHRVVLGIQFCTGDAYGDFNQIGIHTDSGMHPIPTKLMNKTVLITGASSGFGNLAAKTFQRKGWNVVATMRSPEKEQELNTMENVLVIKLDVTGPDQRRRGGRSSRRRSSGRSMSW